MWPAGYRHGRDGYLGTSLKLTPQIVLSGWYVTTTTCSRVCPWTCGRGRDHRDLAVLQRAREQTCSRALPWRAAISGWILDRREDVKSAGNVVTPTACCASTARTRSVLGRERAARRRRLSTRPGQDRAAAVKILNASRFCSGSRCRLPSWGQRRRDRPARPGHAGRLARLSPLPAAFEDYDQSGALESPSNSSGSSATTTWAREAARIQRERDQGPCAGSATATAGARCQCSAAIVRAVLPFVTGRSGRGGTVDPPRAWPSATICRRAMAVDWTPRRRRSGLSGRPSQGGLSRRQRSRGWSSAGAKRTWTSFRSAVGCGGGGACWGGRDDRHAG